MSDAPKHPADPANEFASDNSAIDPRDFRNALGTFAHRRHHRHGDGGGRKALWRDLQLLCLGVAESAAGAVEPRHVLARPDDLSECQPFHGQCSRSLAAGTGVAIRQIVRRQICRRRTGRPDSATRRSLPAASPISSAAPSTATMAATTSSSSARSRPIPTTGRSRCCLRAAASAGSSADDGK